VSGGSRAVPPGGGSQFTAPQGSRIYRSSPQGMQSSPRVGAQTGVNRHSGANYPRHRTRHRGFPYFYGGWWYAYPWWEDDYYYGGYCEYWSDSCASQWEFGTRSYYRCMRDHGCY
jgi:hypothetical protein